MENFFIDEDFFSTLQSYKNHLLESYTSLEELPANFTVEAQNATLEKIFVLDIDDITDKMAENAIDDNPERVSELEYDSFKKDVVFALKQGIDINSINSALPEYYFPTNTFFTITKADLL